MNGKKICVAAKAGGDAMHRRSSIEEDFEVVGELASVSAQIVFQMFLSGWNWSTCRKVDHSVWSKIGKIDEVYSLHTG